jgi:2-polyprenyl-3-methyl-5-hydroxy-6-metoxy-1,4-benzoquinol methylase
VHVKSTSGAVATLRDSWSELLAAQNRLREVRERTHRNFDGGDAGHQWDQSLVLRHAVNYAVAVDVAAAVPEDGELIDVGAGAGGFSVWAAGVLGRSLVIVDQDASHRELASRAFPDAVVHSSMADVAAAPVVFCMEVVEHVQRAQQSRFVADLGTLVRPGGTLVMSTPDESGYLGGWSGYAPHVATLSADALGSLVRSALPGWQVGVARVGGPGFDLSAIGRVGVPAANRAWSLLDSRLPRLTHELAYRINLLGNHRDAPAAPDPSAFEVGPAEDGNGTGLVAKAVRPT